jgi:hypothetical protein
VDLKAIADQRDCEHHDHKPHMTDVGTCRLRLIKVILDPAKLTYPAPTDADAGERRCRPPSRNRGPPTGPRRGRCQPRSGRVTRGAHAVPTAPQGRRGPRTPAGRRVAASPRDQCGTSPSRQVAQDLAGLPGWRESSALRKTVHVLARSPTVPWAGAPNAGSFASPPPENWLIGAGSYRPALDLDPSGNGTSERVSRRVRRRRGWLFRGGPSARRPVARCAHPTWTEAPS